MTKASHKIILVVLLSLVSLSACSKHELIDTRTVEGKATGKRSSTETGEFFEIDTVGKNTLVKLEYWPSTLPLPQADDCVKIHARIYRDRDGNFEYEPTGHLFVPCDFDSHFRERMTEGIVRKSWKSGKTRFIEVVVGVNPSYSKIAIFDEEYFGKLNPHDGDCVKVWISDHHGTNFELINILDRNITSCEK